MAYDVNKVIDIAKAETGYLEKSNAAYKKNPSVIYSKKDGAGHDNITKYNVELHKLYPAVMDISYWCDSFVDWCFLQAYGVANAKKLLAGDFDDYTVNSANLYKKAGAWYTTPKIGDQIFFTNGVRICHTGIVVDVIPSSNTVVVVEGNTSNTAEVVANGGGVFMKYYKMNNSRIAGYGRPAYGNQYAYTPHWVLSNGTWYYRVAEGVNAHGWMVVNGHWYYFHEASGAMQTGVKNINGSLYYLMESGELEGACCKTAESGALSPWAV